jgi:cell division protein FtsZ
MVKEGLINLDFADVRAVMREMGKAMMGTGEASGEKRALSAAEAAISNPLIDDASMKGARGLLISITGGKDLTLYEVDEAATRIREEVDQDANIIVGATFDEGLEGVIRVSVVATGIDHVGLQRPATAPEARIAELTQKLRADQTRAEQHQQQRVAAERIEARMPSPAAAPAHAALPPQAPEAIEAAAKAAVAAALMPTLEDVTIRPIPPKPSLFPEQMAAPQPEPPPVPRTFIPPPPERTVNRPRRMPAIDELPRPAQAELRAKRGEEEPDHPEKRKVSLLRRLAAVGLGRREDQDEPERMPPNVRPVRQAPPQRPAERPGERSSLPPPRPSMPAPAMPRGPEPAMHRGPEPMMPRGAEPAMPRAPDPVSEYARRPPPQPALDPLARQAPIHTPVEEDQLEIPAFLRRQAN